ncbi:hypothetical protein HT136_20430 [Novosphingobium profundi]|uniref:LuxR C-terminal-related transcriptional regulator n=1 Tax=Novosphingobium profundi TaxID=1774954 RepID=UPI001BD9798B|nr:hypothetical protein [Novosphingobium profundi]
MQAAQIAPGQARLRFALPPSLTPDVRLDRLTSELVPQGPARLVQVCGPSGLGKTTLMIAHAHALVEQGIDVRWLDLALGDVAGEVALRSVLEAALAGRSGTCVLVIDAGECELGPLGATLADLLAGSDGDIHIRLVARRSNAALLGRLRSAHRVRTLDPASLLLTAGEVARYHHLHAPADALAPGLTDWPLAQDIALGGRKAGVSLDVGSLLDLDGGLLEAALEEGVWRPLAEPVRRVLAQTAIFDLVEHGFLARQMEPGALRGLLREIGQLAPLAEVRSGTEGGFSLHPLLRGFVARKWEILAPETREAIYREALLHYAERDAPEAAVALVGRAGDQVLAQMAVEIFTSTDFLRTAGASGLRAAMAQIAPGSRPESAQVRVSEATVAMKEGRFVDARRTLEEVRASLSEELAFRSPTVSRVFADFVIAQHVLAFHSHTKLTEEDLAQGYFWSTYTNDRGNAAFVNALRSLHYLRRDELELAVQQADISKREFTAAHSYYGLISVVLVEGLIALAAGRLDDAGRDVGTARALLAEHMPLETGLFAVAQCIECAIDLEQGRTEGLLGRVDGALRDLEASDGWPDAFTIGYRVGACAALAGEDVGRSLALLDRARRLMRGRGLLDLARFCAILQAKVRVQVGGACEGDWRGAAGLPLHGEGGTDTQEEAWPETDETQALDAWQALQAGDHAHASRLARRLHDRARAAQRTPGEVRGLVLLARAHFAAKDLPGALVEFGTAVSLAEPQGLAFVFLEQGPAILPLLEAFRHCEAYRGETRRVRSFCSGLARTFASELQKEVAGIDLTLRELQILHGLSLRMANKEIARSVDLSVSAIKFHLGNLYAKLGVNKRSDAVLAARRLGIAL